LPDATERKIALQLTCARTQTRESRFGGHFRSQLEQARLSETGSRFHENHAAVAPAGLPQCMANLVELTTSLQKPRIRCDCHRSFPDESGFSQSTAFCTNLTTGASGDNPIATGSLTARPSLPGTVLHRQTARSKRDLSRTPALPLLIALLC
jgi:hypothetical protein